MRNLSFKRHRFLPEMVRSSIWLYARFALSLRDVEEMFAERRLDVSYETVRCWFLKFGPVIAANLKRARPCRDYPMSTHNTTALSVSSPRGSLQNGVLIPRRSTTGYASAGIVRGNWLEPGWGVT
jgi:hypothetical protein